MVQITYTLRLDMRDTGIVNTSLRLKQGDSGMKIAVNVFNGGVSAFDSSTTPKIVFRRPDGASVMADMTVESSSYSYTLVGNELQVPGKELIDIKFPIGAEGRESTMSCSIEVVPDTITPNTHGSGIYDNDLAELVEEATEAAETVQEVVGDSEAWANGERNGVPVGPEDPAYHNNSKYWSEQANPTALANLTDVDVDGVANGDVLQYNSSTQKWEGKSISSGTNEIIAPVEGATSLHAYAVGEQLIYNDTLYKVIAPIAVNDALVVDTNIEVSPKTVIEQVEDNASEIDELWDAQQTLGAWNLAQCTATNKTTNNVTYTINAKYTVTASWSSTPTGDANLTYTSVEILSPKLVVGKTYRVSGCPSGGAWGTGNKKYILSVYNTTDGTFAAIDTGEGATFTPVAGKQYNFNITIGINAGDSGTLTFEPMICLASEHNTDYTSYAMTNRELTEVKVITGTATNTTSNATMTVCSLVRVGRVCQFIFGLKTTAVVNVGSNISFTISGIPKPKGTAMLSGFTGSTTALAQLAQDLSCTIRILGANTGSDYNILLGGTYITED